MENECYQQLQPIISLFPHLHQFLNNDFIREQCEKGLKCYLLKRLDNKESSYDTRQHLPTLEKRLTELATVTGYDRFSTLLRGASDWDEYQEILAQIDVTLWFKHKGLLKEVEPELPHRMGNADVLISLSQGDIYCEVTSFQSIIKSFEDKTKMGQPWKTEQGLNNKLEIKRAVRKLLDKTSRQLPPNHPGILALETSKSAMFGFDVRRIAQQLFKSRPHVALIMLWSWESSEQDESDFLGWSRNNPSFCFINAGSKFREVGETLLKHLSLKGEVAGI